MAAASSRFEDDEGRCPVDMTNNNLGNVEELNRDTDAPFKARALYTN